MGELKREPSYHSIGEMVIQAMNEARGQEFESYAPQAHIFCMKNCMTCDLVSHDHPKKYCFGPNTLKVTFSTVSLPSTKRRHIMIIVGPWLYITISLSCLHYIEHYKTSRPIILLCCTPILIVSSIKVSYILLWI